MENLFFIVVGMSLTGSLVILFVLLARLVLHKAPKIFSYVLWAVVLFRLLCPFSIDSAFSLLPSAQMVYAAGWGGGMARVIQIQTGIAPVDRQINDFFVEHPYQGQQTVIPGAPEENPAPVLNQLGPVPDWRTVPAVIWLSGVALLLGYSVLSMLRLRWKLAASMPLEGEKDVRLADHIPSPFVLGVIRPKIYLPSGLPEGERDYILLHERTHIRRCDHIFRALAWLALSIHWFNPLVWLAFHLAGKDMEMSCDEAVLRNMGRDVRADYSSSLLRLSTGKRLPAGPLAFGDGDPQSRIKNVLSWKKPALWVVVTALIAVVCAGAALATNPGSPVDSPEPPLFEYRYPGPAELWVDYLGNPEKMPWEGRREEIQLPEFPGVTFCWTPYGITAITEDGEMKLLDGMPIWNVYFCDLDGDGYRELCATASYGSGMTDNRIRIYNYKWLSFYELEDRGVHDYSLQLVGDQLAAEERDYPGGTVTRVGPLVMTESGLDISGRQTPAGGAPSEAATASSPIAELTLSLDQSEEGRPYVRMEGSVGGVALPRGAFWYPGPSAFEEFPDGYLSMVYPGFTDGIEGYVQAGWAYENRTSVTLSTRMTAMLSSLSYAGYWDVTVDLESGTVTEMAGHPAREGGEVRYYPESISDEEAVKAARVAAKLLTAAEGWYLGRQAPASGGDVPGRSQPERVWSWGSSEDTPDKVNWDMEEWARANGIHYQFSKQDIDSAIAAAQAYLEERAKEEWVISFEVTDVYEARMETLHHWFMYFDRTSTFFTDWAQEDMETRYIVIGADYICEYDHTLTPMFDGEQQRAMILTRPTAEGAWSVRYTGSFWTTFE